MEGQKFYGYMRCSSREQNEDRQLIALKEMGISEKQIYMDKQNSREGILTDHNIKNYCGN